ncbi:HAMP domain-containing protein [Marinicella sp. W31]|uniref:HAMP domain-containing protein n=1 Tax=Marinicella sp. W31 TaxID=3023713 RepID=UPI00375774C4
MNLRIKFNVVMITCLLLGLASVWWFYRQELYTNVDARLLNQARLMLSKANSLRNYHDAEVRGLLEGDGFKPQQVGSYAISRVFEEMSKTDQGIGYKAAILNSDVPRYRPKPWEIEVIDYLRENATLMSYSDRRSGADGDYVFLAKPMKQGQALTGAEIITVAEQTAYAEVGEAVLQFALLLGAIFLILLIVFNVLLHVMVIRPIQMLSKKANKISTGDLTVEELDVVGADEISQLASSFNRMHRSLKSAMNMLGQ